jgi:hypothetical protein
MSTVQKGLVVALTQLAIVASIGAKLKWDRSRLPRAWAKTVSYDPNLPIRGRYVSLSLNVKLDTSAEAGHRPIQHEKYVAGEFYGTLGVKDGQLIALPSEDSHGFYFRRWQTQNVENIVLAEPVLFFLPEHARDPFEAARGGELWAEVTVPKQGPPRPIRLAVKRGDTFTPLEIK